MTVEEESVRWGARPEIELEALKTKTKKRRHVPISARLRATLEMKRVDPEGKPHPADAFVFGNSVGERANGFARAWRTAVMKAHGITPEYTETANLTPASRAAYRRVNLHFHYLRRECGSRWMDGRVPIATIQRWLGHSNVSQTSTYLSGTATTEHDAFARLEAERKGIATDCNESETPGHERPQSDLERETKPNKTGVGRGPAIM